MLSTVTGASIGTSQLDSTYWVRNMCSPVQFFQAIKAAFPSVGQNLRRRRQDDVSYDGLVEIGPHGALQGPLRQILIQQGCAENVYYTTMLDRGRDACATALEAAGALWANGYPVNLQRVNSEGGEMSPCKLIGDLPSYPWK